MTESKIEKKILYIVIFILIGMLLILIFGMTLTLPKFKISSSLATFLGALMGAGISGGTAIYVMHRDIYSRKEERRKESNDNFIKSFELINMWSDSYLQSLILIHEYAQLTDGSKKNSMEIELAAIGKCKSSIESINDDYIPRKVYKEYLDLKTNMDLTHSQYNAYIKTIQLSNASGKSIVVKENQTVKKWILDTREEIKAGFVENLKVMQGYKDQIE